MKTIASICLISLTLCQGCSPQKRLSRFLEHHPELSVADTLRLRDTVVLPLVRSDTLIDLQKMTDTVLIDKERLQIKLFRQHDTLYVEGKCKPDTIIRERLIPVEKIKIIKPEPKTALVCKLFWILTGILMITLIWLLLHRLTN